MITTRTLIILFFVFISACSTDTCDEMLIDSIHYHDSVMHSDQQYFLYSRTTGWHDKVVFFELYNEKPTFDQCSHSAKKPIFTIAYDDYPEMQYVKEIILQPNQTEKLNIIYTKEKSHGLVNVYDAKFKKPEK